MELSIAPHSVNQLLHYLTRDGWIERLRPGTYTLAYPRSTGTPIHEFEIGTALTQPSAIDCSGWIFLPPTYLHVMKSSTQ